MSKGEVKNNIHDQFDLSDEGLPSVKEQSGLYSEEDEILEVIEPDDRLPVDFSLKLSGLVREARPALHVEKKSPLNKPIIDEQYQKELPVGAHEKVVISEEYRNRIPAYEEASRQPNVIVDPGHLSAPEHHKDKIIIDETYQQDILKESPEDFIPELPSELLEEIESEPEDITAKENVVSYENELRDIAGTYQKKITALEIRRDELKKSLPKKGRQAVEGREKITEVEREIAATERNRSNAEAQAAKKFEAKTIQNFKDYEAEPEKIAAALKQYEASCASIEDDYRGDLEEAKAEHSRLYADFAKAQFSSDFPHRLRVGYLKRLIDVALPALREERLQEAEKTFQNEITPTAFDRDLLELTVAFEKKTLRIHDQINNLKKDAERYFPDAALAARQRLNALAQEAQHVAAEYSRDVASLKELEEEKKRKKMFKDAVNGRLETKKVMKETAPPEYEALSYIREIENLVVDLGEKSPDEEEDISYEVEVLLQDGEREVRNETARVSLESAVLGVENDDLDAEEREEIKKNYIKQCEEIVREYTKKTTSAMKEFAPLYDRFINKNFASLQEEMVLRKQVADLRYILDVRLETERKTDLAKARQSYERALTPTAFKKELFAATVRFEKQASGIEEQKKNIKEMMEMVRNFPGALQLYNEELKKLDHISKEVAKKYGEEIRLLKKEQQILNENILQNDSADASQKESQEASQKEKKAA